MGSAPFHLPREKYGSPKGTSVFTLNQSLFFSKIGVCFFSLNRSLFFWSELGFFENRRSFFLKIGVCFLKIGVYFFENRGLIFGNWSLSFLKIGVCSEKNRSLFFSKSEFVFWKSEYWPQILCCHSALEFEQNQWQIHGRGRGVRPRFIFSPNWGPKTLFGDRPHFPLSEGLYSSFSIKTKSDFQKTNFDFN